MRIISMYYNTTYVYHRLFRLIHGANTPQRYYTRITRTWPYKHNMWMQYILRPHILSVVNVYKVKCARYVRDMGKKRASNVYVLHVYHTKILCCLRASIMNSTLTDRIRSICIIHCNLNLYQKKMSFSISHNWLSGYFTECFTSEHTPKQWHSQGGFGRSRPPPSKVPKSQFFLIIYSINQKKIGELKISQFKFWSK